ncbi:DDB1- and CUL4-associated factor 5 [Clupea harengus]|uniref:DDB1- and CUL4-associated factor 5 n=1 Tax=Clupea harengus TaxID=7950 RepID=A0A6P3VIR9_CLUHA|nr:DDB1- and CUL4-associated factor 5 [Clupea harengus]
MKEVMGCGMRSSVGFLSRRNITGHHLMKEEFQRRRLGGCTSLFKKDLLGHFGCVNAIEFSNNGGDWLVSGGDDRRVLLWDMEKSIHSRAKPIKLKGEHLSNIFCLAFDSTNKKVFSGGNDEQVILHDVERGETLNVFLHDDAVYGLSVSPVNDNVFASSADDGRVLIWDTREPPHGEPFCLASYTSAFHSVMFNPAEPRLLATANSKEGVGLWDIRKPRSSLLRYGGSLSLQSAMSVRFNSTGTQLLALRRRLPPVLYELHSRLPSVQFDNQGYFNSCTMKSCCFAGDRDQYILSGSDDFNLYMWKIPKEPEAGGPGRVVNGAFMVLKGHRSIVNQVRFNPHTYMICSSGVEKVIKAWSPYQQPDSLGDLEGLVEDKSRSLYTHEEYISLVLNSGSGLSHDYVSQSIQEDPRMMAFFDSLVRREIEGWSSDSDSDLSEGAILQLHARGRRSTRSTAAASAVAAAAAASTPSAAREVGVMHADPSSGIVAVVANDDGPPSNSENSSSSSLAGPELSEEEDEEDEGEQAEVEVEGLSRRQRGVRRRQSAFMLDLVNEDSDSSGFWFNPVPRPRSPSPPLDRSSLSSQSRSASESDSSSSSSSPSSSSSSEGEEEEEQQQRRSNTRQCNAARRRVRSRMHLPSRDAEDRPATAQDLCSTLDPCSYPKITIEDASSSSSSSGGTGCANTEKKPRGRKSRRHHRLRDDDSPVQTPGNRPETRLGGRVSSRSPSPTDSDLRCVSRAGERDDKKRESEGGKRERAGKKDFTTSHVDFLGSQEPTRNSEDPHQNLPGISGTAEELDDDPTDSKTREATGTSRVSKRTRQGSELRPEGSSLGSAEGSDEGAPSEKKLKT